MQATGVLDDPSAKHGSSALVHYLGRFDWREPAGPRCEWSGCTLRARFRGTGIGLRLRGAPNHLAVTLDARPATRLRFDGAQEHHLLASDLPHGEHEIEVIRLTEASFGSLQFLGFDIHDGELVESPVPYTRTLELVGDSITCGYGNQAADGLCGFEAETENESLAYGALAARALDAAHEVVAWSGRGLRENYAKEPGPHMPELYERVLASDATTRWDFAGRPVDLVVIHLGTNDGWNGDPGEPFTEAHARFLEQLRALRPETPLLAVMAPEPDGVAARVEEAVRRRQQADPHVHFLRFAAYDPAHGYGADFHPSVAAHRAMASELETAVRSILGW